MSDATSATSSPVKLSTSFGSDDRLRSVLSYARAADSAVVKEPMKNILPPYVVLAW